MIGAGTGVFPYLDFITLLIRYSIHKLNLNGKSDFVIDDDENFDYFADDFNLILMGSFPSENCFPYLEICRELEQLNEKYNLNLFKFLLRLSSQNKIKWNNIFMIENLPKHSIYKIYLSGPVRFMDEIKEALLDSYLVKKEHICYV